ncbi:MAG: hypothetical protein VW312_04025, partial [Opitutales bacterium]
MAINKNFVVKNGLEVNSNLIVADTDATASSPFGGVGIGTSVAPHTLHVNGGIGVTHLLVTGIATFNSNVAVGGAFTATGVGSFGSNVAIDGTLTVQGVNIDGSETSLGDDLVTRHIKATGLSTFVGFSTFQDFVFIQDGLTVTGPATVTGFSTFSDFVHIQDGLNVSGIGTFSSLFIGENQVISSARELQNIDSLDETTRLTIETALEAGPNKFDSLLVTGISTFTGIATFGSGVGIADSIFHLDDTDTAIRFPAIGSFAIDIDGAREVIVTGAGVTIAGIATVTGTLDANGGLEANSAKIEDLTDNRVVIAGSGGELEDDANLTFDGDGLVVGVGLTVAGLSTVTGVGTFFSQVFLGDKLVVAGISTFADTTDSSSKDTGSLIVEGGVGIEKQLFVGAGASVG